ncbi:hypothetical protein ACQEV9_45820 [Streptomyces chartreusis]|uniref:hypothetical protein n=1 Tax=Streptomyces chartreusis TaxID=1969 RepID=UPI003D9497E6
MTQLLDLVLKAHGGKERWSKLTTADAVTRFGGPAWSMRQVPDVALSREVTVDFTTQRAVFHDYTGAGLRGIYTPDHVSIVDEDGRTVRERHNPVASFQGLTAQSPWDMLHALYFIGYATWNYLTAPQLLTLPGVQVEELVREQPALDPQPGLSATWQRLGVTFPDNLTVHNKNQIFYYDENGLQRRMDYAPRVTGGIPAVHMVDGHQEFSGLVFPTRRRVYIPNPEGQGLLPEPFITVEYADIRVE